MTFYLISYIDIHSFSDSITILQKSLFLNTFLRGLSLFFSKRMKKIQVEKNHPHALKLFHEIMQIIFLLQDNAIFLFLHLES